MKAVKRKTIGNRKATVFRSEQKGRLVYCVLADKNGKVQVPSVFSFVTERKVN
jgi:hypothetical protein